MKLLVCDEDRVGGRDGGEGVNKGFDGGARRALDVLACCGASRARIPRSEVDRTDHVKMTACDVVKPRKS